MTDIFSEFEAFIAECEAKESESVFVSLERALEVIEANQAKRRAETLLIELEALQGNFESVENAMNVLSCALNDAKELAEYVKKAA